MWHAGIVYSAHDHHGSSARLRNWRPELEHGRVTSRVRPNALAEPEIVEPEIASKVRGSRVAGRSELIEIAGKLSIVSRRVVLYRLEQRGHGVHCVSLPDNGLVLGRQLIRFRIGYGSREPDILPAQSAQLIGLLPQHADLAAQSQQFPGRLARLSSTALGTDDQV